MTDFSFAQNCVSDSDGSRTVSGSEFHRADPKKAKLLCPYRLVLQYEMMRLPCIAERKWLCVGQQIVPHCSAGNWKRATADCREKDKRHVRTIRTRWAQSSSWRHVCNTGVKQDWRYLGPAPWMARYVKTDNLKEIRSGTRSQWRVRVVGFTSAYWACVKFKIAF